MALSEIQFELSAEQYRLMAYPGLKQGQSLCLTLDGGILLPDPAAPFWFTVQAEPLAKQCVRVSPALYAFAGQIDEAEIEYGQDQMAYLSVDCGCCFLRLLCGPADDGQLPYGTWETRYIAGVASVQGLVEDSFEVGVGQSENVTLWHFHRLVLRPGDHNFGQWHESVQIPAAPFHHDRIYVTARLHRRTI